MDRLLRKIRSFLKSYLWEGGSSCPILTFCFTFKCQQWKAGDPEPDSWFDLYRYSPCVPVDYFSITKALGIALEVTPPRARRSNPSFQQVRSVRILLRPGKYYLKQAIEVQAVVGVTVSMETMEMPRNLYRPVRHFAAIMEQPLPVNETAAVTKRAPSFRSLFSCNRQETNTGTESEETDFTEDWLDQNSLLSQPPKHATMILRSRRHNEPVFRVRQGVLRLKHVEIQHNSHGLDIWNGNAAVQIQPPLGEDEHPIPVVPRPTACLERVQVSSKSGRGIVNIDGGKVILRQCAVTDCAATGVYIGGPGSQAIIERSDVIRNGVGNRTRRGIARGHSGIYLEQGVASIRHSNVSSNSLTGISVVSPDNAVLTLEDSTLVSNGTYQLELPPPGTASRQRCVTNNNTLAVRGEACLRSGLTLTEPASLSLQQSYLPQFQHLTNS
jgi:Right handed beta helix region